MKKFPSCSARVKVAAGMGYSLLEMLLVLALLAMVVLASAGSWARLRTHCVEMMQQQQLLRALQYARYYAMSHRVPVKVCGSSDLQSCDSNWSMGYLILAGAKLLKAYTVGHNGLTLRLRGSFGRGDAVEFGVSGYAKGYQGGFEIYGPNSRKVNRLRLSASGDARWS